MSIQLVIRHNLEEHEATFTPGELRTFDAREVRIGGAAECECTVAPAGADALPPVAVVLRLAGGQWTFAPVAGVPLFLNQEPVAAPGVLRSGDTLRCGHWTFRFHKAMRPVRYSKSADLLSAAAKVLAVLILVVEVGIVYWLPRQVRSASQWELQIARAKEKQALDDLRGRSLGAVAKSPVEQAARKFIGSQLDTLAAYVRKNQDVMTRDQWREVGEDLDTYRRILAALDAGNPFGEPPPLATEAAFRAVTKQ